MARALIAPLAVQTVRWDELQNKLRVHYAPKPLKFMCHHMFYQRNQEEGETINMYVVVLRKAALHCEFRDLDEALLDRLVCGVRDCKLKRRLLAKPDLTLRKAMDEAQAVETPDLSTQDICNPSSPTVAKKPITVYCEDSG